MVNNKISAKTEMMEHSQAKVKLYEKYLATYLNIITRVPYINKIYLYDLFCGEGIYKDGGKGSPVVTLETLKRHFYQNKQNCPNIELWLNDKNLSEVEPSKYRIDRVREICSSTFNHENIKAIYTKNDYLEIYPELLNKVKNLKRNEKALLFIDPYGYKEVKPTHIKELLSNGNSELILFTPISHMHRFANKSIQEDFPGGEPIKQFLNELFHNKPPHFNNLHDYINKITEQFKIYLGADKFYVDTFTIERDDSNTYCLFFFTSHILGFEKMLETKWDMDEKSGKGFRLNDNIGSLFAESETSGYETILQNFLKDPHTNEELYRFGLKHGFLPKHTSEILKKWQKNDKLNVYNSNQELITRKNAFYLPYINHLGAKQGKTIAYIQLK